MADEVNLTAGSLHYRLDDVGLVRDGRVAGRAAFRGSAISEQARGDAPELVAPRPNHRPPGRAGAARSGHEHDRRPGPALVVLDSTTCALDHRHLPFDRRSTLACSAWPS